MTPFDGDWVVFNKVIGSPSFPQPHTSSKTQGNDGRQRSWTGWSHLPELETSSAWFMPRCAQALLWIGSGWLAGWCHFSQLNLKVNSCWVLGGVLSFNPSVLARLGKRPTFADEYLKETFLDFLIQCVTFYSYVDRQVRQHHRWWSWTVFNLIQWVECPLAKDEFVSGGASKAHREFWSLQGKDRWAGREIGRDWSGCGRVAG